MQKYDLSHCPLFIGLEQQTIEEITDRVVEEVREAAKGEYIVRQTDAIFSLILLVRGTVRTEMITKEGNLLEIDFIEAVHPLAPAFIYAQANRFPVDVIAAEDCVFYVIPREKWLTEMMGNATLLTNFLRLNSNMTIFLSNKIQMISLKSLKAKLALFILDNTDVNQPQLRIKRTRTQLAEFFGVQRPSLARTIGEMIDEGLIRLDKRDLTVLNRSKLEQLV